MSGQYCCRLVESNDFEKKTEKTMCQWTLNYQYDYLEKLLRVFTKCTLVTSSPKDKKENNAIKVDFGGKKHP